MEEQLRTPRACPCWAKLCSIYRFLNERRNGIVFLLLIEIKGILSSDWERACVARIGYFHFVQLGKQSKLSGEIPAK